MWFQAFLVVYIYYMIIKINVRNRVFCLFRFYINALDLHFHKIYYSDKTYIFCINQKLSTYNVYKLFIII